MRKVLSILSVYIIVALLIFGWLFNHTDQSDGKITTGDLAVAAITWPIGVPLVVVAGTVYVLGQAAIAITKWP